MWIDNKCNESKFVIYNKNERILKIYCIIFVVLGSSLPFGSKTSKHQHTHMVSYAVRSRLYIHNYKRESPRAYRAPLKGKYNCTSRA